MSIIETFFMMFSANADEAERELDQIEKKADKTAAAADKATDSLGKVGKNGKDGLDKAKASADKLKSSLLQTENVTKSLSTNFMSFAKGLILPLAGAFSINGLMNIAKTRANEIDELNKASSKVKMPVGDFEAFGRAARDMGGDVKGAEADLSNLFKKVGEASINPKSDPAKQFGALGVKLKDAKGQLKSTYDILLDVSRATEKMNETQAIARMRKLGIADEGTIQLLLKGRKAVEGFIEAQKQNGVVTEEQARIVSEYKNEVDAFGDVLKTLGNSIASYILPIMTKLSQWFRSLVQWVSQNKTLVYGFFIGLAAVLTGVYLPAIIGATIATLAFLAPYAAIIASVLALGAAFALVYEDVRAFMDGQPSLIGDLSKKYETFAAAVDLVAEAYRGIPKVTSENWADMPTLTIIPDSFADKSIQGLKRMGVAASEFFDDFGAGLEDYYGKGVSGLSRFGSTMKEEFDNGLDALLKYFENSGEGIDRLIADVKDAFSGMIETVKGLWSRMFDYVLGKLSAITGAIKGAWNYVFGEDPPPSEGANYLGGGGTPATPSPVSNPAVQEKAAGVNGAGLVDLANSSISGMNASPFNGSSPQAVAGSVRNDVKVDKSVEVKVGSVTISTQATDAAGIAGGISSALQGSFRDTASHFDDGVSY